MQVVHGFTQTIEADATVATIGVFDGVHLGHQALIGRVVQSARAHGRRAAVVTFSPSPYSVLGGSQPYDLTTLSERLALFEQLGIQLSVVVEFTLDFARLRAAQFVKLLASQLHLGELWVGHDFALGYEREGDVAFLQQAGQALGFGVHTLDATALGEEIISSSRIRSALRAGDVTTARHCLGRPFRLTGAVVQGAGRGRSLGIPTANLSVPPGKAVPAGGVYACFAHTDQTHHHLAVTNIGTRPTFDGLTSTVEAHVLDFEGELYNQPLSLDFITRLRAERKFDSAAQLVAQVHADIDRAREFLAP